VRTLLLILLITLLTATACKEAKQSQSPAPTAVKVDKPANTGFVELAIGVDNADDRAAAMNVMRRRVQTLTDSGLLPDAEPLVRLNGDGHIVVRLTLPGGTACDGPQLTRWQTLLGRGMTRTGQLSFHRVVVLDGPPRDALRNAARTLPGVTSAEHNHLGGLTLKGADFAAVARRLAGLPVPPKTEAVAQRNDAPVIWVLDRTPIITGPDIAKVQMVMDDYTNRPAVSLDFTKDGGTRFGTATESLVNKAIAIVFEGEVTSAPVVNEPIKGGRARIDLGTGAGGPQQALAEANELVAVLSAGPLVTRANVLEASGVCPIVD